jgi:hypothetical protein
MGCMSLMVCGLLTTVRQHRPKFGRHTKKKKKSMLKIHNAVIIYVTMCQKHTIREILDKSLFTQLQGKNGLGISSKCRFMQ